MPYFAFCQITTTPQQRAREYSDRYLRSAFASYLSAVDDLADAADDERDNAAYADILSAYAMHANRGD